MTVTCIVAYLKPFAGETVYTGKALLAQITFKEGIMPELSDNALVRLVQNGDRQAMADLYQRHRPAIFRYVRSMVYDQQLAQDLTGEIFLRMVAHLPDYQLTGAPFSAWLFRIARNYTISYGKKESRLPLVALSEANRRIRPEDTPAVLVERQIELERILESLDQIDENQREVVILRFLVGLPLKEVAHILDKTVGAVKTLQHRGILALRLALKYE